MFSAPSTSTSTALFFGAAKLIFSQGSGGIKMSSSPFDRLAGRTDAGGGSRDRLPVSSKERAARAA